MYHVDKVLYICSLLEVSNKVAQNCPYLLWTRLGWPEHSWMLPHHHAHLASCLMAYPSAPKDQTIFHDHLHDHHMLYPPFHWSCVCPWVEGMYSLTYNIIYYCPPHTACCVRDYQEIWEVAVGEDTNVWVRANELLRPGEGWDNRLSLPLQDFWPYR